MIGPIAVPDQIHFTDALPKTRSGKIMRRLLRDVANGVDTKGDMSTLEDLNVLAKLRARTRTKPDSALSWDRALYFCSSVSWYFPQQPIRAEGLFQARPTACPRASRLRFRRRCSLDMKMVLACCMPFVEVDRQ